MGERPESVVNLWAAPSTRLTSLPTSRRGPWVVHTSLLGPVRVLADSSTYPQAGAGVDANTLAQGTHGRLRRWIMLIYVDWVPPDFTTSRSWPFSMSRDRRPGYPLGILPNAAGIAVTRVLHTGRVCPESMCLWFSPPAPSVPLLYGGVGHRLRPPSAPGAASHGARCPR